MKSFSQFILFSIISTWSGFIISGEIISNENMAKQLNEIIGVLKDQLPVEVEDGAMLVDLKMFGARGLEYVYEIPNDDYADSEMMLWDEMITKLLRDRYCTDASLIYYRINFIEMKWSYLDNATGKHIYSINADPNDC